MYDFFFLQTLNDSQKKALRRVSEKSDNGYGLCWDNIQINPHCKHQGKERKAEFLLWALSFAYKNRVPTLHLKDATTIPGCQLIPYILPQPKDYEELRNTMVFLVMRILIKHLPFISTVKKHVPRPKHQYII